MNEQMTYHVAVQRANRVQHIVEEIGIGQIIKEKYIGYLPYEIIDKLEDKMSFEKIYSDDKKLTYDIYCCYKDDFLNPASKKFVEMLDEKESVN